MLDQNDEASTIDSLKNLIPESGFNIGAAEPEPTNETPAKSIDFKDDPAPAKEAAPEPVKVEPAADEDAEIDYEGERYKVPAKLKDAFLRQADYTKKTTELANERKALAEQKTDPAELAQVKQKLTSYEQLLGQQVEADTQKNWVELLEKDPVEYLRQKELAEARNREWATVSEKRKTEQAEQTRQTLTTEAAQLIAKRPEWKDEAVWKADMEKIKSSLAKEGFRQDEIGGITDHRALIIADKARKYDELMAAKTEVVKKIEKLPPKVERPGVPSGSDGQSSREAMARLRKSGSIDDAVAALRNLM